MAMQKRTAKNIDEYIDMFPKDVQNILEKIRQTVHEVTPEAVETISYQMPAFKLNGRILVYFAAFQKHIGFYSLPSGNEAFKKELLRYKIGKGSIQFQLSEPIPYDLIKKIIAFRMKENLAKKKY